jgi:predicted Zn finger-like uncharacterized protein
MKFYCDACNTKYAISDDKVRGKILKVRCKNCGNIITVREARAPVASVAAPGAASSDPAPTKSPPEQPSSVPTTNWYYAVNGQTQGPFTLKGLREQYASGSIGDETYVWHEALTEWKPVATVDAFSDALARGQRVAPRRKTIGFSGQLEAVKSAKGPSTAREGAVPTTAAGGTPSPSSGQRPAGQSPSPQGQSKPLPRPQPKPQAQARPRPQAKSQPEPRPGPEAESQPKPRPKPGAASPPQAESSPGTSGHESAAKLRTPSKPAKQQAPTPESRPIKDARRDKLERLRARLGGSKGSEPAEKPSKAEKPEKAEDEPSTTSSSTDISSDQLPTIDEGSLPRPVGGGAVLTFADGLSESSEPNDTAPEPAQDDAVDFDLPPRATPAKLSPSSTSDILEQAIGPIDEPQRDPSAADSGVIPFFDEGPSLDGKAKEVTGGQKEVTSGSLLIDLQNIKKEGRGKRVMLVAALVVVGLVVAGLAVYAYMNASETEPVADADNTGSEVVADQKDELVIPTYSDDEQGKIATMELGEEVLSEDAARQEGDEAEAKPTEEKAAKEPARPAKGSAAASPSEDSPRRQARREPKKTKKAESTTTATVQQPSEQPTLAARTEPEQSEPKTLKEALLQQRRNIEINRPKDKLREQLENKTGLSKDEARRGFRRVKESVRVCRERHNRRTASMKAKKIKLSVKVRPDGRVASFRATPRSVQNTEFERCMQSHKGRWRFAQFNGDPVVINTSIILQ